ncbi:MAG: hypothetical protein JEZ06_20070 [Anaerolineaceae bacterium]|nr:hypothetical protein [Anaerolineaceae bacterium]
MQKITKEIASLNNSGKKSLHNPKNSLLSRIRDNHEHGRVPPIDPQKLRIIHCLCLFHYDALKDELDGIECLQFLFGEPMIDYHNL